MPKADNVKREMDSCVSQGASCEDVVAVELEKKRTMDSGSYTNVLLNENS